MAHLKNYYVVSLRFNGLGKGFAIGVDDEWTAIFLARVCFLGLADVLTEYQLELKYPTYFHQIVSKTA